MPSAAEEDYLRNFNAIITKGRKDNTYKFALARFLIDYSESLDEQSIRNKVDSNTDEVIEYSLIAKAFLRYYWHQICKYKIKQNFNSEKLPLIVQIIQGIFGQDYIPEPLESMDKEKTAQAESEIKKKCFSEVIPRFQNLMEGNKAASRPLFYEYDRIAIHVKPGALLFFKKNYSLLFKAVILEWAKFLERTNHGLPRLISKIEDPVPERHSLERYKRILREKVGLCFYCDNPLSSDSRQIHADHFIPWSYVYEDEIWNLVLTCSRCNLRKHSSLPQQKFVQKLVDRYGRNGATTAAGEFRKSLVRLDADGKYEYALNRYYQNCLDYGFTIIEM